MITYLISMWYFYLLIAVVLMSVNTLLVKQLVKDVKPVVLLFYQYLISIPVVGVYGFFMNASFSNFSLVWLGFIYVLGIALFYQALSQGDLSRVSPVFNQKMLVTVSLGVLFLGESLSVKTVIGLVFGVIGVWLLGGELS